MRAFLQKVIKGNGISPPEVCQQSFVDHFADAVNVEWFRKEGYYEAIFYMQNLEHIALFSYKGILEEYKHNLSVDHLPEPIKDVGRSKGEIMNAVLTRKGKLVEYEIIVRDHLLKRHLVILSDLGEVIEEKLL